jgi:hypothetical protein
MATSKRLNPDKASSKGAKPAGRRKGPDLSGPAALGGIAGLRRVAGGGMLSRMQNAELREMRIREVDARRRLQAANIGREASRMTATQREVARTGVGQSPGYKTELVRADGKKIRGWTLETFPRGGGGKIPTPFSTPGSLPKANAAGTAAIRAGVPRTTPPGGNRGVEGGARIRGFSARGGQGGGGGGIGKDKNKIR